MLFTIQHTQRLYDFRHLIRTPWRNQGKIIIMGKQIVKVINLIIQMGN